jgi:holo-[acyl-carrier protein] synthase
VDVRVGIDLVDVGDVDDAVGRWGNRYLARVFTTSELDACRTGGGPPRTRQLAAILAAKEATFKVLLSGDDEMPWHSVEITRPTAGTPSVRLTGAAQTYAVREHIASLSVGVTCRQDQAAAVVLAELHHSTTEEADAS